MDFGKVEPEQISSIDFTLPPETDLTKSTFTSKSEIADFAAYIGCAK